MNLKILIDGNDQRLYQWDRGQRLLLHGYEAGTRVDFARCNDNKAVSKYAYSEGEAVFCDIPDALLMDPTHLHGYVYEIDGDRGETVREFMLPVIRRPKPEDYVEPEEVLIWHELEQRISALEENGVPTGGGFVAQPEPPEDTSLLWIDTDDESGKDEDPAPGGYYTPTVSQPDANTMEVAYTPSAEGMPEVRPVQVTLPAGPQGNPGYTPHIGDNGNWWIGDTDTGVSAGGAGGATPTGERWELLADVTVETEIQTYEHKFDDTPMRKLLVIVDTLAADADASHCPVTVSFNNEAGSVYKPSVLVYPLAVPRKSAHQSVYEISTFYMEDTPAVDISALVGGSIHGKENTKHFWHFENLAEPYFHSRMVPEICRWKQGTYETFAPGTRYRIYGVRA